METRSATSAPPSFLETRRGKLTLALMCAVAFMDLLDGTIVNVALPVIRTDLHFSVQSLQWVPSAYLLTYGGFLLLGGRLADLLGRRRLLVAGTSLFGISSLVCGLAGSEGVLIGGRLAQGVGAAMMTPAALSILTTSFHTRGDRVKALGAWGGMGAVSGASGVLFGGVLTSEVSWRWVFFVNLPMVAVILAASFRLVDGERPKAPPLRDFDTVGAGLITGGMLLLVYVLVNAPNAGWGTARTLGELAGAVALIAAVPVQRAAPQQPARASVAVQDQGPVGGRCHPGSRVGRLLHDVLPRHALHGGSARLLGDPHWPALPAADGGHRARSGRGNEGDPEDRHPAAYRRGGTAGRRRSVLAFPGASARHLSCQTSFRG